MSRSSNTKAQLWSKRLRDFEASSLSVAQFCQSIGCSCPTFYLWKRKLTESIPAKLTPAAQAKTSAQPAFLQVQTTSECFLQVKLLSGVVIAVPMEALDSLPLILERIA